MKKNKIIAAMMFVAIAVSVKAQQLTPMQLKEARMATYRWIDKYTSYSQFSYESSSKRFFCSLFESGDLEISNSYLPQTDDSLISVNDYADLVMDTLYRIETKVTSVNLEREYIENDVYQCDLRMGIECGFVKTDDRSIEYPKKNFEALAILRYNEENKKMKCVSFTTKDTLKVEYVFHEDSVNNRYIESKDTISLCQPINQIIGRRLYHTPYDYKIVAVRLDTIKNNIHIGASVGPGFVAGDLADFSYKSKLYYDFYLGYYRQLYFKSKNRIGVEINLGLSGNTYTVTGEFHEKYSSVDPDGGMYERWVDVGDFNEKIKRVSAELPIAVRFDKMINKRASFFARLGVSVSYDLTQKTNINANVKYSGYYDWLFDVVIDQNGIYDFGTFDDCRETLKKTAFDRLGVNVFAGIGFQHFLPKHFSLEYSLQYKNRIYNSREELGDKHLTDNVNDWNSSSYYFKSFNSQNLNFNIQLNYNF
ncbi:MAG: hypothetical protein MJ001_05345 [Paludibacteraceae bacterium]|nr:hypothetical protein [Paludibacteraceae bacterium]